MIRSRATTCQSDALSGGFIEYGGSVTDTYSGLRGVVLTRAITAYLR